MKASRHEKAALLVLAVLVWAVGGLWTLVAVGAFLAAGWWARGQHEARRVEEESRRRHPSRWTWRDEP